MPARILLIEDNRANLELMQYLLQAFGYSTIEVHDGAGGVEMAMRDLPDLIICDLQLPTLDGYGVVRALKQDAHCRSIPIVAVTAFAMVGDRDKVLAAGFDGYISKPIAPETFVTQVAAFIPDALRGAQAAMAYPATTESSLPTEPRTATRGTILAVDNISSNLSVLCSTFEPIGFAVITTGSVAEAIDVLREHVPDVIVSDMHMPDKTGHDLLRRVRSDPRLTDIPFILLSSTHWSRQQRKAFDPSSVSRLLTRPIDPQVLIAEVEACLQERRKGPHGDDSDR